MTKNSNTLRRFSLLLVGSLVLHIFIFFILAQKQPDISLNVSSQLPSINIQLSQVKSRLPKKITKPANNEIKKPRPQKIPEQIKPVSQTLIKQTKTAIKEPQTKPDNSANRARIISKVREKMRSHFYYPRIAQTKNWHGTVKLFFNFDATGNINDIHIARSSGFSILDDAAINALSKVKQINTPHLLSLINQAPLELTVIYQLKES